MTVPYSFEDYCALFEKLINYGREVLLKIVFNIFDYDEDGKITLHDLISLLKTDQTDHLYQDYETLYNILRSKNVNRLAEGDMIEARWITYKDVRKFDLTPNQQDKVREERYARLHSRKYGHSLIIQN